MQAAQREIAVVDDDAAVRESLTFLLEVSGHRAVAYDSADALLQRGSLDYLRGLILDQNMPGLTGLGLAAKLRDAGWQFPILLITGAPSPGIRARAMELDIKRVLEKPPTEADIMAFIDGLGD